MTAFNKMFFFRFNKFTWVLHVLIGFLAISLPITTTLWFAMALGIALVSLLQSRHPLLVLIASLAYFSGMEMSLRLSGAALPHEVTKYTCILLLIIGTIRINARASNYGHIILILILLISIPFGVGGQDFERTRQLVSANLSGPILLIFGVYLFSRVRQFGDNEIKIISLFYILPSMVTTILLFFLTSDVESITFTANANFEASGYGPNQMSAALGIAATLIVYSLLFRNRIIFNNYFLLLLLGLMTYRILLTFSRGGLFTFILVTIAMLFIFWRNSGIRYNRHFLKGIVLLVALITGGYYLFNRTNQLTSGILEQRLMGDESGIDINEYSSGRTTIMNTDFKIFLDYPLIGIGPGMGYYLRKDYGYRVNVSAHIEYTRLLAEHGIPGLIILFFMLSFAFRALRSRNSVSRKAFIILTLGSSMLFMLHSATRLAAPMVLFGFTAAMFRGRSRIDQNSYVSQSHTYLLGSDNGNGKN